MQTLLLTVLVLGVIVFVHELGHFVTAKWMGIATPRFSLGLGPRVVGVKIGETDYCLSAIPFGGYVKMAGMEGEEAFESVEGGPAEAEEAELEAEVPPEQRFESKSRLQRLVVLSAGVLMNFVLGWVIYVGLAWNGGIPTVKGTQVAGVDSTALVEHEALAPLADGGVIASVDGREVSNWYEINEAIEESSGAVHIALDSGETLTIPIKASRDRAVIAMALEPLVAPVVAEVEPGGPAAKAGLQPGDRIVSIAGESTNSFGEISRVVRARPGELVPVAVERTAVGAEPRRLSFTVQLATEKAPRPEDGRFVETGYIGIGSDIHRIELGPLEALVSGTVASGRAGTLILGGLYQLVTGAVSMRSLGGPVAIHQLTGHFASQGTSSLLAWVALFSINLAILNLLPIPVLDGGHIMFLGIEATRGRPLSARQKMRLSQVGLAMLVLLMAWAFTADILRLVGI